jgi:hypothetical protein
MQPVRRYDPTKDAKFHVSIPSPEVLKKQVILEVRLRDWRHLRGGRQAREGQDY